MSTVTFSGLASGIDSASLIESLISQQRSAKIKPLEEKVSKYEDTQDSLDTLKGLLAKLKSTSEEFRIISGGALSKNATSSDESVATVSSSNLANTGNYEIAVNQLAKAGSFSFSSRFLSNSSLLASDMTGSDTINITVGDKTTSITVNNSTTVESFVEQFNSNSSNAKASLINVGSSSTPQYALMINSNNSGTQEGTILIEVGESITNANASLDPVVGTLSQAQDANLSIAGLADNIQRSSNTISDLIPGLTLKLSSTGTANLATTISTEDTAEKVQNFVDAFNDVVSYIKENDAISTETDGDDLKITYGSLSNTSLDENILSKIKESLRGTRTSGGSVNILAEMGITTKRDGTLNFDTNTFEEALNKDSSSVEKLLTSLGDEFGAVDGTIAKFTRYNGLIDQGITNFSNRIKTANNKISSYKSYLSKYEERLTTKYANLESLISKLNSQQTALSLILSGL